MDLGFSYYAESLYESMKFCYYASMVFRPNNWNDLEIFPCSETKELMLQAVELKRLINNGSEENLIRDEYRKLDIAMSEHKNKLKGKP